MDSKPGGSGGHGVAQRLSVMMFLEFLIWGSWYVSVGGYMGAHKMSADIAWIFSLCPIAAIVSPFFLGMVADRFFDTEKILGILSIVGGIIMMLVPTTAATGNATWLNLNLLLYALCFMPTLSLTSSLTFHNVTDQEKQFPIIRVFGTIGWIAANWIISKWLHADTSPVQFYIAGGASILLGFYSFTLPHTPPPSAGKRATVHDILGLDALALLKQPSFLIFIISSLLICIPLASYYAYANLFVGQVGIHDPTYHQSFGQIGEIFFMLLMPILFVRLGVKYMLLAGMLAWVVRYGLFTVASGSANPFWLVMGGILLHGMCYDFFFVTGQIYGDKRSTARIRGQVQGFIVLVTQGVGMLIGAQVGGQIFANVTNKANVTDWRMLWLIPSVAAAVIAVLFFILFRDDSNDPPLEVSPEAAPA